MTRDLPEDEPDEELTEDVVVEDAAAEDGAAEGASAEGAAVESATPENDIEASAMDVAQVQAIDVPTEALSDVAEPDDLGVPPDQDVATQTSPRTDAPIASAPATQIVLPADSLPPMASMPAPQTFHGVELPLERRESEERDPVDEIFPPELRMPAPPPAPAAETSSSASAGDEPLGQPLPRVQVMVTLADARALFEEVLDTASERTAPRFRQIAEGEVRYGFWVKKCEERAADWRLRGP